MSEDDNASLLNAVALKRDLPAFEGLYDRHRRLVYGIACRMMGEGHEAEDVLQEVFLRVWERAGTYDATRGSAPAWLAVMTRSRCLDRLRQRSRRREQAVDNNILENNAPAGWVGADPEQGRILAEALKTLPKDQRVAVETVYFKGLTQLQTAQSLKLPLGTVKGRLRLAMDKLALALGAGRVQ